MLAFKKLVLSSSMKKLLPATSTIASIRQNSEIAFLREINPASMKVGRGGRSSFSGKVVTVFGHSCILGEHLVSHLAKTGTQVVVPYRFELNRELKTMGDLGQIVYTEYSLYDDDSLRRAMMYSDTVINLIGIHYEDVKNLYQRLNVESARKIARIAREMGVPHFIHVSALNSNIEHEGFWRKGGSIFLRSKHLGELAVKEEYPNATIFRPSDMFGIGDAFFSTLLSEYRVTFTRLHLPYGGKGVFKQPVHILNMAQALTYAAMNERTTAGITYEAIGPHRYEFYDLVDYLTRITQRDDIHGFTINEAKKSARWLKFKLFFNEKCIIENYDKRVFNVDRIEREAVSDTTCGLPTLKDLGIRLISIEEVAQFACRAYHLHLYCESHLEDVNVQPYAKYTVPEC